MAPEWVYLVSHDFLQCLRTIVTYAGILNKKEAARFDEDSRRCLDFIESDARHLQALVKDLVGYIQAEVKSVDGPPVSAKAALDEAVRRLQQTVKPTPIEITADALPEIMMERAHLVLLFEHLLGNAVRFNERQPVRVHVSVTTDAEGHVFTVRDNGIGIDPSQFERIFKVLQRLHPKKTYPGSGLGLALCKKIVEGYGGKIWVESEPGQGSTFYWSFRSHQKTT